MRLMFVGAVAASLVACGVLQKGAPYAANPVVVGSLSVASAQQCAAYRTDHPEDAATLRDYLIGLQAPIAGCIEGLTPPVP